MGIWKDREGKLKSHNCFFKRRNGDSFERCLVLWIYFSWRIQEAFSFRIWNLRMETFRLSRWIGQKPSSSLRWIHRRVHHCTSSFILSNLTIAYCISDWIVCNLIIVVLLLYNAITSVEGLLEYIVGLFFVESIFYFLQVFV